MVTSEQWEAIQALDQEHTNYKIRDQEGNEIATVYARMDGQTAIPARLMAAAPRLLSALDKALPILCAIVAQKGLDPELLGYESGGWVALRAVREAIDAATEERPKRKVVLAETAEWYHKQYHYFSEVDWRDCPQDPCPERARAVSTEPDHA